MGTAKVDVSVPMFVLQIFVVYGEKCEPLKFGDISLRAKGLKLMA